MVLVFCKVEYGERDGSRPAGNSQSPNTALKLGHSILKYFLGWVSKPCVDVPSLGEVEKGFSVIAAVKDIAGGLVDGYCAGSGCTVCLFLSCMQG